MRRFFLSILLSAMSAVCHAGPVNINTADAETLAAELKGVGLARAQAIIEYRESVGPYRSPEDLLEVAGVGPKVLELNKGNIRVSSGGANKS